jgi:hypothetical protein
MTEAVTVAVEDAKGTKPTFDFGDETWTIVKKPSVLMLAEFARTETSDEAAAFGVLADFFEAVLGEQYPRFRKVIFNGDFADEDVMGLIPMIIERTMGRPTE